MEAAAAVHHHHVSAPRGLQAHESARAPRPCLARPPSPHVLMVALSTRSNHVFQIILVFYGLRDGVQWRLRPRQAR